MGKKNILLLVMPAFAVISFIFYYPGLMSLFSSFTSGTLGKSGQFIGFNNYALAFNNPFIHKALGVTLYFTFVGVGMSFLVGLAMALIVNQKFRGRGILRTLWILPWAVAPVAAAMMFKWIFHGSFGALNSVLMQTGISSGLNWLSEPFLALNSLMFIDMWEWAPFMMLILLAGLQRIPPDLYKAAKVDRANVWHRFRHVTLPFLIWPATIALLIRVAFSIRVFDIIYVLTAGGPALATKTLNYYVYKEIFVYTKYGYGSAVGYFMMLFSAMIVVSYFLLARRRGGGL